METTTCQSTSELSAKDNRENESIRNRHFRRKRHTLLPSFFKSVLVACIEKHMAEYSVEFLDNDQRLHVVLPPGNYLRLDTRCIARRDLEKAMDKTKLYAFFEEGEPMQLSKQQGGRKCTTPRTQIKTRGRNEEIDGIHIEL